MASTNDPAATDQRPRRAAQVRNAAIVMGGLLALLWAVQIADSLLRYRFLRYGIEPRHIGRLEDIFTAPFIHVSYSHLAENTLPLLVLGFLVAMRGVARYVLVSAVVVVVSGLGVWLTAPSGSDTVGASGVIFGYFGYLIARGVIDRRLLDLLVGLAVGVLYWSIVPDLLPGHPGISWQGHLFGLMGGVLSAWMFRRRRPELTRARTAGVGADSSSAPAAAQ